MHNREQLRDFLRHRNDVLVNTNNDYGLEVYKYKHLGVDFTVPEVRIARGLTMDKNGNVLLCGYPKFFNNHQLDDRDDIAESFKEEFARFQWGRSKTTVFKEKLDGSLILLGFYNDVLIASTTGSLSSEQAKVASAFFNNHPQKDSIQKVIQGYTWLFEYVGPSNKIVVSYEKTDFVLLDIMNNSTFKLETDSFTDYIAKTYGFTRPKAYYVLCKENLDEMLDDDTIEGFVAMNSYGNLIKFKTESWFKKHSEFSDINVNKFTKQFLRTVLAAYRNEELDDFVARLNQAGNTRALGIAREIVDEVVSLENEVEAAWNKYAHMIKTVLGRKQFALSNEVHPFVKHSILTGYERGDSYFKAIEKEILKNRKEKDNE